MLVGVVTAAALFAVALAGGWNALQMGAGVAMLFLLAALVFRAFVRSVSPTVPVVRPRQRRPGFSLREFVLGPPLATHEMPRQTVGKFVGLAVFGSDVLSSVAYATEEMLVVLALAGTVYFGMSIPISIAISALLLVLTVSYRQTIFAYPNGGGAYIVARDNLGEGPAQAAGAALLTDYILTVSVSIASGVAQIASAFPALLPWRGAGSVAALLFMMLVDLRGGGGAGEVFAAPPLLFSVPIPAIAGARLCH